MYTCDHCNQSIDQYKDRWGDAKNQNGEGSLFTVENQDGPPNADFEFKVVHDDDTSRHYHYTCACAMLSRAIADAAAMGLEPKEDILADDPHRGIS